jgi:DUF4097 and DUF4098 domain-containing protein YvlB
MSNRAVVALTAAVAVGLAVAVSGCGIQVNIGSRTMTDDARVAGGVTSIDLTGGGDGDVKVQSGPGSGVDIHRTIDYRGKTKPRPGQQVTNGVLTFTKGCSNCSVSYLLTVPAATRLEIHNGSGSINVADVAAADVESGSGDVRVRNVPGQVRAYTGSGSVRVDTVGGQTDLHASSGDIVAAGVHGGTLRADTGSGSVNLNFSAAPSSVRAETGSGDLHITLPDGPYRIDHSTGSGDEHVRIDDDPTATATVYANTGSGSIWIVPTERNRALGQPTRR